MIIMPEAWMVLIFKTNIGIITHWLTNNEGVLHSQYPCGQKKI